ncbi:MAG: TIGR00730 family Rossman fold protein, partial [Acidiferrobacteraceae bacterium]|nr:TIGR00730 family Rossman fold protein [Acidiferrobacteraceae bacterium]
MRLCVFCGSKPGDNPAYAEAAAELGRKLAEQKIGLVYGGASVGLMGVIADATLQAGGDAIGVIPQSLIDKEIAHPDLTQMH